MRKKITAIHFGAGNIGRGLIASIYKKNGIHVIFMDIDKTLINSLNENKVYAINYDNKKSEIIDNFDAFYSIKDLLDIINNYEVKFISTSIGTKNFIYVKDEIKQLINLLHNTINVISFENDFNASTILKNLLNDNKNNYINCIVDRIVPNIKQENLNIYTEHFYEIVLDKKNKRDNLLDVGVVWTNNFESYLYKKLWLMNTTHLMIGYLFKSDDIFLYQMNKPTYNKYFELKEVLENWFKEIKMILISEYKFSEDELDKYIENIKLRIFSNLINDNTKRLRRDPIKKLKKNERVISLYLMFDKYKQPKDVLYKLINEMLSFFDMDDEQSKQLSNEIKMKGKKKVLLEISNLNESQVDEILCE